MKIAVTGSTGYIGSRLVKYLETNHEVIAIEKNFQKINCDIIYHLACPSNNTVIHSNPKKVMDIIFDLTRQAIEINPLALFVNASSIGAGYVDVDNSPQNAYNIAKRSMEVYLAHSHINYKNYRIPSVYGPGMHNDGFIKLCVNKLAYFPPVPDREYFIAHIDDVVEAMANLNDIPVEKTTLGKIYQEFTSGQRTL